MKPRRGRAARRWRCPHCGKGVYRNRRIAARLAARLPEPGTPYWHPEAGGYCITRLERGEYDARRAAHLGQEDQ